MNPLTAVPWGNPQQAGSLAAICSKAGLAAAGCGSAATSRRRRRTLLDASCKYWYLYLDTTEPAAGSWDPQAVISTVRGIMSSGQLKAALAATRKCAAVVGRAAVCACSWAVEAAWQEGATEGNALNGDPNTPLRSPRLHPLQRWWLPLLTSSSFSP